MFEEDGCDEILMRLLELHEESGKKEEERKVSRREETEGEETVTSQELLLTEERASQRALVQTTTETETIDRDLLDTLLDKARSLVSNGRKSLPDNNRVKDLIRTLAREKTLLSILLYLATNISSTGVEVENLLLLAIQSRSITLVAFFIAAGFKVDVAGKVKSAVGDGGLNGTLFVSNAKDLCTRLSGAAVLEKMNVQKALKDITALIDSSDRVNEAITILNTNKLPHVLAVEPIEYDYKVDKSDAEQRKLARLARKKEKDAEQQQKADKKEKEAAERRAKRLRDGKSALSKGPSNWCIDILNFTDHRLKGDEELERLANIAKSIFSDAEDFAFALPAMIDEIRNRAISDSKDYNDEECNRSLGDIGEKAFGSVKYANAVFKMNKDGRVNELEEEAEERNGSVLEAADATTAAAYTNETDETNQQPEGDVTIFDKGNNDNFDGHSAPELPEGAVALTLYAPDRQRFAADVTFKRRATIYESSDHSFQQATLNHDQAAVFGPFSDNVLVTVHPVRSNIKAHFENKSKLVLPAHVPSGNLFTIYGLKGQKTTVIVASHGPALQEMEEGEGDEGKGGQPDEEQGNDKENDNMNEEDEEEKEKQLSDDDKSENEPATLENNKEGSLSSTSATNNENNDDNNVTDIMKESSSDSSSEKNINEENDSDDDNCVEIPIEKKNRKRKRKDGNVEKRSRR